MIRALQRRRYDAETGQPTCYDICDIAGTIVDQGIITALALVRTAEGVSPDEAIDMLIDLANNTSETGSKPCFDTTCDILFLYFSGITRINTTNAFFATMSADDEGSPVSAAPMVATILEALGMCCPPTLGSLMNMSGICIRCGQLVLHTCILRL